MVADKTKKKNREMRITRNMPIFQMKIHVNISHRVQQKCELRTKRGQAKAARMHRVGGCSDVHRPVSNQPQRCGR